MFDGRKISEGQVIPQPQFCWPCASCGSAADLFPNFPLEATTRAPAATLGLAFSASPLCDLISRQLHGKRKIGNGDHCWGCVHYASNRVNSLLGKVKVTDYGPSHLRHYSHFTRAMCPPVPETTAAHCDWVLGESFAHFLICIKLGSGRLISPSMIFMFQK